jgi:WD40 repeat protein
VFNPSGTQLASADVGGNIAVWDVATGKNLATWKAHTDSVPALAYSPDGQTMASGGYDKAVKLWDAKSHKNIATWTEHTDGVNSVAFSKSGKTLASGSEDFTLKLWDVATGKMIATMGQDGDVYELTFGPDDNYLILCSQTDFGTTIRFTDPATWKTLTEYKQDQLNSIVLSPDGSTLVLGGLNVELWEVHIAR